jgi:hypothetical protein
MTEKIKPFVLDFKTNFFKDEKGEVNSDLLSKAQGVLTSSPTSASVTASLPHVTAFFGSKSIEKLILLGDKIQVKNIPASLKDKVITLPVARLAQAVEYARISNEACLSRDAILTPPTAPTSPADMVVKFSDDVEKYIEMMLKAQEQEQAEQAKKAEQA